MQEIWSIASAVITALGGGALIVLAFSTWLGKVWANRVLEQDRLKYQGEFERLKSELTKKIHEHNVAVSRIDAQQAETIQRLYFAFVDWFETALEIRSPRDIVDKDPLKARAVYCQWGKKLQEKAEAIERLSVYAAIYLAPETHKEVIRCGTSASTLSIDYCDQVFNHQANNQAEAREVLLSAREKLEAGYRDSFEPARDVLISQFRQALDPRLPLSDS